MLSRFNSFKYQGVNRHFRLLHCIFLVSPYDKICIEIFRFDLLSLI